LNPTEVEDVNVAYLDARDSSEETDDHLPDRLGSLMPAVKWR
jgi:hypothetical protein